MAEKKVYGLKSIKFGAPMADGSMPIAANMSELFRTYRDSAKFVEDDADLQEEFSDQSDDPVITLGTKGKKTIEVATFDYDPTVLMAMKGGTVVDGVWNEPANLPEIFKAVELETDSGTKVMAPKGRIFAKFNAEFKKKGLSLLEIKIVPNTPAPGKSAILIG